MLDNSLPIGAIFILAALSNIRPPGISANIGVCATMGRARRHSRSLLLIKAPEDLC
jgi:hypothetical protein